MEKKLEKKIKALPPSPGVYLFYGKDKTLLYVGKAGSLRDRTGSYFSRRKPSGGHPAVSDRPIEIMIGEVADIEVKKTDTVLEAYILEQALIKKLQPKYNALGKDDKSFSYVAFTKEEFSRPVILRETDIRKISSKGEASRSRNSKNKKPENAKKILSYARTYGPYTSKKQIETALKILRKIFPFHNKAQKTEKGCLDYQIGLCPGPYDGAISKKEYAENIRGIRMILEGKKKGLLNKMRKEMERCASGENFEKAADIRNKIFALQHIRDVALISSEPGGDHFRISKSERGTPKIFRMEGYDISNISGSHAVGSMAVFDNSEGELKPNKNQYRKFKIKTVEGIDDVGAMTEVLARRFKNNWPRPDLILLDGGAGHLNATRKILRALKIEIPLLAVAKGPTRKKLDIRTFGNVPEISGRIIEQVRDEAHRFAVGYHRKLRRKNFLERS